MPLSRREFIKAGVGMGAAMFIPSTELFAQAALLQKKIPSSGEMIPVIGLGTARRYEEVKTDAEKVPLRETIAKFQELGLKVIDSSSSYGTAEAVVGEIVEGLKIRDSLFLAKASRFAIHCSLRLKSACARVSAATQASQLSSSPSRDTGPTRSI